MSKKSVNELSCSKSSDWGKRLDGFLACPPLSKDFAALGSSGDSVTRSIVPRHGNGSRRERKANSGQRMLQIVFAAFIDFMCENIPEPNRSHLCTVLKNTVVQCGLVPSIFLSEDFLPVRNAFRSKFMHLMCNDFSPNPNIDIPLLMHNGPRSTLYMSRYVTDFEEISMIGEGGFGKVFHVRSRIDGCEYAVKKIPFSFERNKHVSKAMIEVRLLASFRHKNIVRYYGAWAEINVLPSPISPRPNIREMRASESDFDLVGEENSQQRIELQSGDDIDKENRQLPSSYSPSLKSWQSREGKYTSETKQGRFWQRSGSSSSMSSRSVAACRSLAAQQPRFSLIRYEAVMFVQMELCSRTLSEYFLQRCAHQNGKVDREFNNSVIRQLLSALDYIHSKNVIHRDVKPCNLFLRERDVGYLPRVLLGDFGLACHDYKRQSLNEVAILDDYHNIHHSAGVGTSLYAAPEQLTSTEYDSAVDIYSAGIVSFELYCPTKTAMERNELITKLRAGEMDPAVESLWPAESRLIRAMCDPVPNRRPRAFELLSRVEEIKMNDVRLLQQQIDRLERIIQLRDEEIGSLKEELAKLISICQKNNIAIT